MAYIYILQIELAGGKPPIKRNVTGSNIVRLEEIQLGTEISFFFSAKE